MGMTFGGISARRRLSARRETPRASRPTSGIFRGGPIDEARAAGRCDGWKSRYVRKGVRQQNCSRRAATSSSRVRSRLRGSNEVLRWRDRHMDAYLGKARPIEGTGSGRPGSAVRCSSVPRDLPRPRCRGAAGVGGHGGTPADKLMIFLWRDSDVRRVPVAEE
jgi:hypothetical protein